PWRSPTGPPAPTEPPASPPAPADGRPLLPVPRPGGLELLGLQPRLQLATADGPHAGVPPQDGRVVARRADGGGGGELVHRLAVAQEDEDRRRVEVEVGPG